MTMDPLRVDVVQLVQDVHDLEKIAGNFPASQADVDINAAAAAMPFVTKFNMGLAAVVPQLARTLVALLHQLDVRLSVPDGLQGWTSDVPLACTQSLENYEVLGG